ADHSERPFIVDVCSPHKWPGTARPGSVVGYFHYFARDLLTPIDEFDLGLVLDVACEEKTDFTVIDPQHNRMVVCEVPGGAIARPIVRRGKYASGDLPREFQLGSLPDGKLTGCRLQPVVQNDR